MLTQETLLLNRRRHKEEVRYEEAIEDGTEEFVRRYFIVKPEKSESESTILDGKDDQTKDDTTSEIPFVYACATMWHETKVEMTQLMKSLFRLDQERQIREEYAFITQSTDGRDRFNYQAHIFFDDALEMDDNDKWQANVFVRNLIGVMSDACSAVHKKYMQVHDPYKVITPYGAQLIWEMPGGSLLYVHVKDKNKIRHRKRWSQVMYMYYLLGYQLLKDTSTDIIKQFSIQNIWNTHGITELLNISVQDKIKNTFILALDGDTDFSPASVRILLDRMANDKVAAACGRIHPIGSGPMVWYQMFEYAVGHWLQKATEHVLGCVLCSPGCFSLFRASALMDNNVMKKYTTFPTEPGHFLQYDQGEDRWLCTLLLQQGYRVDYAAAADAYTYAPEGFNEFFNQRRRWTPSTIANIMDLLTSTKSTVARNANISYLYIFYQIAMMVGTVLGPGTVIMMIAGAIGAVFNVDLIWSYVISLVIPAFYIVICFTAPTNIQLTIAAVLSAIYAFIMMAVIAGTVVIASQESPLHPSVVFTILLFGLFLFAGFIHYKELNCLPHCFLYFMCIPSGYLLLFIYSMVNLNNVSWGTRELPKRKSKRELKMEKLKAKKPQEKKPGFLSRIFFNSTYIKDIKGAIEGLVSRISQGRTKENQEMITLLKEIKDINKNLLLALEKNSDGSGKQIHQAVIAHVDKVADISKTLPIQEKVEEDECEDSDDDDPEIDPYAGPHWAHNEALGNGPVMQLSSDEEEFWELFIEKYLKPIDKDEQREKQIKDGLIELRNAACFAVAMINALWIALNFMFQLKKAASVQLPRLDNGNPIEVSILGLIFIIFFTTLIIIQFFGMLAHRWDTFLHMISVTNLRTIKSETTVNETYKDKILERLRGMIDPLEDYGDDDDLALSRIKGVVEGGQTGRDIARSLRNTFLSASRRLISETGPNLKSTLLSSKKLLKQMNPGRALPMGSPFATGGILQNQLRSRFYKPVVNHVRQNARDLGFTINDPAPDYSEEYDDIRHVMPGRMGREFARKVRYLKESARQRDTFALRLPRNGGFGHGQFRTNFIDNESYSSTRM